MKITGIKTFLTAPGGCALVVVRVDTSDAGLYGLGCATFTQRATAVKTVLDDYMRPLLLGRDPDRIEDIWRLCMHNAYWRNGAVMNNALSGVDMALWDIKGKRANMPLYQLLGGKCREAAAVYRHADGQEPQEVLENMLALREQGYRHIRCQTGGYGGRAAAEGCAEGVLHGRYFDPNAYMRKTVKMFEHIRDKAGFDTHLLHDIHERLGPMEAVRFAKDLEPFKLFFLEDPLPPESVEWFQRLRQHAAVPIAMGEMHNHPLEWRALVCGQLIDYVRTHVSQIGGITRARKLAAFCEEFGIRTAWHGPADVSPVGHAANLHLDLACHNFGIQEYCGFTSEVLDLFPGMPEVRNGFMYPNERSGLGIEFDESASARYPVTLAVVEWTQLRLCDGTLIPP